MSCPSPLNKSKADWERTEGEVETNHALRVTLCEGCQRRPLGPTQRYRHPSNTPAHAHPWASMPFLHIRVVVLLIGEAMDFAPLFVIPSRMHSRVQTTSPLNKRDVLPFSVQQKRAGVSCHHPLHNRRAGARAIAMTQGRLRTYPMAGCSLDVPSSSRPSTTQKWHGECRGTRWHDVVYSSERVYIVGLVVLLALDFGHCRFYEFDLQLETCSPGGCGMQTPCMLVGKWDW